MKLQYQLTRKKIKRVILRVLEDGSLQVNAPFFVSQKQIESFLEEQIPWIENTRKRIQNQKKNKNPFQICCQSGEKLSIFGKEVTLQLRLSEKSSIYLGKHFLYVFYRQEESKKLKENIYDYFLCLLKDKLEFYLKKYSETLQLFPSKFQIKTMKSAWGIYHTKGNDITFNSLLLTQAEEFIEYVVVHELCHLRYLNHQKEFWNLVADQIPNYREIRKSYRK